MSIATEVKLLDLQHRVEIIEALVASLVKKIGDSTSNDAGFGNQTYRPLPVLPGKRPYNKKEASGA